MAKQRLTVELDDATIRGLAVLGDPPDVLARLAETAVDGVGRSGHQQRLKTDESLQVERDNADNRDAEALDRVETKADKVVKTARARADEIVHSARDDADDERRARSRAREASSARERSKADVELENERSTADAVLATERAERRRYLVDLVAIERDATDKHLIGERTDVDTVMLDQREANERLVGATIRAQELADEAEAAQKRAEESERELHKVAEFREMFIGILGHDLRTPVSSISMSTGALLRRGNLDEKDAEAAARIIRATQRMTRMIAELLDLTRSRLGGGFPIQRKPTDLRDVCRNVVEEFEAAVELEVEGDVTGTWDSDRLAEALSNLAGNGIEYATPGTAVIVRARADGPDVVVEVCNQGIAIPADVLPFIFEPFRRGNPQEKSANGNLGLGLYIAKQIIIAHDGTLDAHSAGGTTTFAVRLPRNRQD